jgi:hypothetical protein
MSWFIVMELIDRRSGLRINTDRDLLTDNQDAMLGRLMGEEYDAEIGALLRGAFPDDD